MFRLFKKIDYNFMWKLVHVIAFLILILLCFTKLYASFWGFGHPVDIHVRNGEEMTLEKEYEQKQKQAEEEKRQKEEQKQKEKDQKEKDKQKEKEKDKDKNKDNGKKK